MRQIFLLAFGMWLSGFGLSQPITDIGYEVSIQPKVDRTELEITAKWKGPAQKIDLPQDYYGVRDIYRSVVSIAGDDGTKVEAGEKPNERMVTPNKDGQVTVRYRLSYDPVAAQSNSFGPITTPSQIQTFLCQWMLRIGNLEEVRSHTIALKNIPKGWRPYTSLAPKADRIQVKASYETLISAMIGAGDLLRHSFKVKNKPVEVVLAKGYAIDSRRIFGQIEKVVKLQREWFNDYSQPFYTISIAQRLDNIAGTSIGNSFVCFIKPDVEEQQLMLLLSHEMFHHWLPGHMHVLDPGEQNRWNWEWFDEGFAEYFARVVLLESGAITKERFIELLNRDLYNIADNPARNKSYDQVVADIESGAFSVGHKKLSYYRGALIASNWDVRIKEFTKGKQSLASVIRDLAQIAARTDGNLTQDQFAQTFQKVGVDIKKERETFIVRGETIPPLLTAFDGYVLKEIAMPHYAIGFDVAASTREKKIVGLIAGSAAEKAGLRDGMTYLRISQPNRFGNAWTPASKATVWVREDGKDRAFEYVPVSGAIMVTQYVKTG